MASPPTVRVFFDTNVWLSAIVFQGLCADLLLALDHSRHELLTSALVRGETHAVLRRKFRRHVAAIERFDSLWACARCIPDVDAPSDDADARLIDAAHIAGTQVFVTGDHRVLSWDPRDAMRIVTPRQAWEVLIAVGQ